MSLADKEISSAGGNVIDNDSEEDGRVVDKRRSKKRIFGSWTLLFPFTKVRSFRKNRKKRTLSFRNEITGGGGSAQRCLFCISRPKTVESPVKSRSSDPNDPTFTQDMVRVFLEKNDFYSQECNAHLSVDDLRSSNNAE